MSALSLETISISNILFFNQGLGTLQIVTSNLQPNEKISSFLYLTQIDFLMDLYIHFFKVKDEH